MRNVALFSWLLGLLMGCFSANAQPADTTRVLFVGNSFTYYNNMPEIFEQLANQAGHPVFILQHTPGGASVGDTIQDTLAHMNNPTMYAYIRNYQWDYLVLQDNQGRFVYNYGSLPGSSKVIEGHLKIRDSLLFYSPCAKLLWFAGWGPKNGYLPYASTGVDLIDRIYANYLFLLDTAGQVIAPIGPAWKDIVLHHPSINLWDVDDVHPGPAGSLLTASVIYSGVFKSNALESNYIYPGVAAQDDSLLKQVAYDIVVDSADHTRLNEITPSIVNVNGNCSVPGYSPVNWFQNGVLVSTNAVFAPDSSMNYFALAFDAAGCYYRTWLYPPLVNSSAGITEHDLKEARVYPNPFSTGIFIEGTGDMVLVDVYGHVLLQQKLSGEINFVEVPMISLGCYILLVRAAGSTEFKATKICKLD